MWWFKGITLWLKSISPYNMTSAHWRIHVTHYALSTYLSSPVISILSVLPACLTAFFSCRFRYCSHVVASLYMASWSYVIIWGTLLGPWMRMVFGMLSSSITTKGRWTLSTLYGSECSSWHPIVLATNHFISSIWFNTSSLGVIYKCAIPYFEFLFLSYILVNAAFVVSLICDQAAWEGSSHISNFL